MFRKLDRSKAFRKAKRLLADGCEIGLAAAASGLSAATLKRWLALEEAGLRPGDYANCGRPHSAVVSDSDAAVLRACVFKANSARLRVSMAAGLRLALLPDSGLSDALRAVIRKPRSDPHALPVRILKVLRAGREDVYRHQAKLGVVRRDGRLVQSRR